MKYGLLAVVRAKLRTTLFVLLILTVTVFLSLGVGMWHSAGEMLRQADAAMHPTAELIYTGGQYPELGTEPSGRLLAARSQIDLAPLAGHRAVTGFEQGVQQRALLAGYTPANAAAPYGNYQIALVRAGRVTPGDGTATASILAKYPDGNPGNCILVPAAHLQETGFSYEKGSTYLVFGRMYVVEGRANYGFEPLDIGALALTGLNPPGIEVAGLIDVTGHTDAQLDAFWQSEMGLYWLSLYEAMQVVNGAITVVPTMDIEAVGEFNHGVYALGEGSFFTKEDYAGGNACLIPSRTAGQLGLEVGDTLTLSFYSEDPTGGVYNLNWPVEGFAGTQEFRICGIYSSTENNTPVYVSAAGQPWLQTAGNDYVIARFTLAGRYIVPFEELAAGLLPAGFTLSINDRGYEAAARPILNLQETALLVAAISALCCLVILWFFAFLFVYRNHGTTRTLLSLGAGKRRVFGFFLSGSGVIALFSSLVGSAIGFAASSVVVSRVYSSMVAGLSFDTRFSRNSGSAESFAAQVTTSPLPYLLTALAVFLLALLLCTAFAQASISLQDAHRRYKRQGHQLQKQQRHKRQAVKEKSLQVADLLPSPSLRYSVKSLLRGGLRSLVVPVVFAGLITFLCIYNALQGTYRQELDTVYETVPVTAQVTDIYGRLPRNMTVNRNVVEELEATGFVAESWTTVGYHYMYAGVKLYADGTKGEAYDYSFEFPQNFWQKEAFLDQLYSIAKPYLVSSSPEHAPEFYLTGGTSVTLGAGFEEYTQFREGDNYIEREFFTGYVDNVLVSEAFLAENGLSYGDILSVDFVYAYNVQTFSVQVIGTYAGGDGQDAMYIYASPYPYDGYNAVAFLLQNVQELSRFKDLLTESFSPVGQVGTNRRWIVVDDAALYRTIETLRRHIGYMQMLYPVILILVAGIGFLVANLLLKSRRAEIAVLRSMGAKRYTVVLSFFWEQFLLSLPGILAGLCAAWLAYLGALQIPWLQILTFALCYYAGSLIAIIHTQRSTVLQSLTDKEE